MSATLEEFHTKFRVDELLLHRSKHWTWSLRPAPVTLGAGILSLNRFCPSFAQVTPEEGADLANATRHLETRLHEAFAPDRLNYLMLMMIDRHLHFHVLPRYATEREVGGLVWSDSEWPKPPSLAVYSERTDHPSLEIIRDHLRA